MASTPPPQSTEQGQAQDQRLTAALRWTAALGSAVCAAAILSTWGDFKEISKNNVKTAVIISEITAKIQRLDAGQQDIFKTQNDQHLILREHSLRIRSLERRFGL